MVGALRDKLANREAFALYLKAYSEERHRLEIDTGTDRVRIVKGIVPAEREHQRALEAYVKGFMSEEKAQAILPGMVATAPR